MSLKLSGNTSVVYFICLSLAINYNFDGILRLWQWSKNDCGFLLNWNGLLCDIADTDWLFFYK